MIKAILVDDEPIILKSLKENYDWKSMGIEIIATSEDGDEAFEKICELNPDLVITDIKMPTLSGIEMIKLLHHANIYPKFIFATGYSDFSYTREAIRLGAYDYILKPFSPDELKETILRCVKEIKETQGLMKNADREFCELQLQQYFKILSQKHRQSLTTSLNHEINNRFRITDLALNILSTVLNPETSPTNVDFDECLELIRRLNFTLGLEHYFAFSISGFHTLIIITYRTGDSKRLGDFTKANGNYITTVQEALYENLAVDSTIVSNPSQHYGTDCPFDCENLYKKYIDSNVTINESPLALKSLDVDQRQKYMHDALTYIHNNYGRPLKILEVAESVYLSESHFSTLFTKHMGTSFSKYLATYRIDKAKVYMQQHPYAKVYEVSNHVGYSDARYFSTLFKKTEGKTPSEYVRSLF